MTIPFWSGKNATIQFSLNDKAVLIDVGKWRIKRYGTKVDDHVCGEQRSRKQFITDGYELSLEFKDQKIGGLQALLDEQKNLDQNAVPYEGWVGILIKPNDGTAFGLAGRNMCIDDWDFGADGRVERNSGNLPIRFDDIDEIPTLG